VKDNVKEITSSTWLRVANGWQMSKTNEPTALIRLLVSKIPFEFQQPVPPAMCLFIPRLSCNAELK